MRPIHELQGTNSEQHIITGITLYLIKYNSTAMMCSSNISKQHPQTISIQHFPTLILLKSIETYVLELEVDERKSQQFAQA